MKDAAPVPAAPVPAAPALIQLSEYQPPAWFVRSAELIFDLDAECTRVHSRLLIERNPERSRAPLRLQGEGLQLKRVQLDGHSVAFSQEGGALVLEPQEERFTLEIENTCAPAANTTFSGLYVSRGALITQCEAEGFRRITFYPDRPDVMAVFTVTLRAARSLYPVLLSNGDCVERGALEPGRHFAKWHDPFPKPSYLFAIAAGHFACRERRIRGANGGEHTLRLYAAADELDKTEHAMESLVAAIAWDGWRFGLHLDLKDYAIVAVPDFNSGAMENKGLNIFNAKYILANQESATDLDYQNIESVVAHEYLHNWTGNRITCRDWFQLSLKEGLTVFRDQEFSRDRAASALEGGAAEAARALLRIEDVRNLREVQFPEDAGPMAHPVRPAQYREIRNFYTATVYEKGAELVRMMQTLVGREGFARGMSEYFRRHDGQAVTCEDFARAIAAANPGSPLDQQLDHFLLWYAQAGTPHLRTSGEYDAPAQRYTLTLTQSGTPSPGQPHKEPWLLPVNLGLVMPSGQACPLCLAEASAGAQWLGQEGARDALLVMSGESVQLQFTGITERPVPSILRGFSAPVLLQDDLTEADLLTLLRHDTDPFNRWMAAQRLLMASVLAQMHPLPDPLSISAEGAMPVPLAEPVIAALREAVMDEGLDAGFRASLVTLPGENRIAHEWQQSGAPVDPPRIHAAASALEAQLARALRDVWGAIERAPQPKAQDLSRRATGERELLHLALARLLLAGSDAQIAGKVFGRFKTAQSMTQRLGALRALLFAHEALGEEALALFYARHRADALTLDKWFSIQAAIPEQGGATFARVHSLLTHADFSIANPNRFRSLVGFFCHNNPGAFHRLDGAGYQLWADYVLLLDVRNPELAARFARALERCRSLVEPLRTLALAAWERVAQHPTLSNPTREVAAAVLAGE